MTEHTPEQVELAMDVLKAQLRFWDLQRELEISLRGDISSDDVSNIAVSINTPDDVTADDAILLLNAIFIPED